MIATLRRLRTTEVNGRRFPGGLLPVQKPLHLRSTLRQFTARWAWPQRQLVLPVLRYSLPTSYSLRIWSLLLELTKLCHIVLCLIWLLNKDASGEQTLETLLSSGEKKKAIHLALGAFMSVSQHYFREVCSSLPLGKCSQAHREKDSGVTGINCPAKLLHQGNKAVSCSSGTGELYTPQISLLD